ncbi:MAG: DCC1-like thiol-disulfide oxidoreductase family protein, partial [Propionibacteriaceae bacterium]|nr:DCC1-like thiol-disulfide oxidoreductase family protein [Propionibacteriaceae bacterium]
AALGVDAARAGREIPFVGTDGSVRYGAPAIAAALRTCGAPWRQAGWLLERWPVRALAAPIYAVVAQFRHRLPGGTAACRLQP